MTARQRPLTGRVRVPGDKSISHRALILGALAVGETRITGLLEGEDVLNTAKAMRALGATVERTGTAPGRCAAWVSAASAAGGAARFRQFRHRLPAGDGRGRRLPDHGDVRRRCLAAQAADAAGARSAGADGCQGAATAAEGGRLPLTLQGARDPLPIVYEPPVASAQLKSAVLLAGLAAPGETTVIEEEATRDHTERMLKHFGAEIVIEPDGRARPQDHADGPAGAHGRRSRGAGRSVVGGVSAGGGADRPGSDIVLDDVMTNPLRTGLFTTLREMGASIEEMRSRAAMAARRSRICACAPSRCAASRCRRSARPR